MQSITDHTRQFIETLFEKEQIIEVRVIRENNNISCGYFIDREALYSCVKALDSDQTIKGIYVVPNQIRSSIFQERGLNQQNRIGKGLATKAVDIDKRKWLVLDFDPIKATTVADSASTDDEKLKTRDRAQECYRYLSSDFPEPIFGDSGNGTHLIYRIDLPNDKESYDLIAEFLDHINSEFVVDVTMKDASRVSKLYGTTARKGLNTEERPHRISKLISIPDSIEAVSKQTIQNFLECQREEREDGTPDETEEPEGPKTTVLPEISTIVSRHTDLFKPLVTSMVARHNGHNAILAACLEENKKLPQPKTVEYLSNIEIPNLIKWAETQELKKSNDNDKLVDTMLQSAYDGQKGISNVYIKEYKFKYAFDWGLNEWFEFQGHSWKQDFLKDPIRTLTVVQEMFSRASMILAMKAKNLSKEIAATEELLKDTCGDPEVTSTDIDELKRQKKGVEGKQKEIKKAQDMLNMLYYRKQIVEFAATGTGSLGIAGDQWDKDPWLLGCKNGIVDLKSGKIRDGKPEDYIRSACPTTFDGNAKCPKFEKYLAEICSTVEDTPRPEVVSFLQRFLGMSLIGDSTYKEYVLFLSGIGRNGKDTLVHTLIEILGDGLAFGIKEEMVTSSGGKRSPGASSSDIMSLRGKRLIFIPECQNGLDMSKVKFLSGGGKQTGRTPYCKNEVTFNSSHVTILQTNNKPNADPDDYAYWKRVKCVEFLLSYPDNYDEKNHKPYERKPNLRLKDELRSETSGILNWLITGCMEFQKIGLQEPECVKTANEDYRVIMDRLGTFMSEECNVDANDTLMWVGATELYNRYKAWAISNGQKVMSSTKFGIDMGKRVKKGSDAVHRVIYIGISLVHKTAPMNIQEDIVLTNDVRKKS